MSRLSTVADLAAGDAIPESWVDAVRVASNYTTTPGADLPSAATINITAEYHRVTGVTTVDNISDALGAVAGQTVRLFATGSFTFRNNGGGSGNIRTAAGTDLAAVPNTLYLFVYDSSAAVWRQFAAGSTGASSSVIYDSGKIALSQLTIDSGNVIVAGFAAIEVEFFLRSATVGNTTNVLIRFNGDTGAGNYAWVRNTFSTAGARSDAGNETTNGILLVNVPASTAAASTEMVGHMVVGNYDDTGFHKGVNIQAHSNDNANDFGGVYSGRWKSASAITSIQFTDAGGGNLAAGSRVIVRKIV